MKRAAVVGAGISGILSAYYLKKAGFEVTIFEKQPGVAMQCSRANGGQISVCNSATWNTWGNVGKGLKWMLSPSAPFLIKPSPSLQKLTWIAGFMRHTINSTHRSNTIETVKLGLQSRELYKQIAHDEMLFYNQSVCGLLNLYTDNATMIAAVKNAEVLSDAGLEIFPVAPEQILKIDPTLSNFKGLIGGLHTPSDFIGDCHLFCKMLGIKLQQEGVKFARMDVEEIERKHGFVFIYGSTGSEKVLTGGYDAVVLANGHEMRKMASKFGDFLNIYPVKGYSISIDLPEDALHAAPKLSLLDDERKIVCSLLGLTLRVAGTAELDGENLDIKMNRIQPLLSWVASNFPKLDIASYFPWACLRPMSSDMMPIVKQSSVKGVWYHGGHGHLGWTLGAATAKQLAEKIIS